MISQRTSAGLQTAKERGVELSDQTQRTRMRSLQRLTDTAWSRYFAMGRAPRGRHVGKGPILVPLPATACRRAALSP